MFIQLCVVGLLPLTGLFGAGVGRSWVKPRRQRVAADTFPEQHPSKADIGMFRRRLIGLFAAGLFLTALAGQASAQNPAFNWANPFGGEVFVEGDTVPISWSGGDPSWSVNIKLVDVALWQVVSGGISGAISNNGSAVWNISLGQLPANTPRDYQLYIQEVNQIDWKYSGTFTINPVLENSVPLEFSSGECSKGTGSLKLPLYTGTGGLGNIDPIWRLVRPPNGGPYLFQIPPFPSNIPIGAPMVTEDLFAIGNTAWFPWAAPNTSTTPPLWVNEFNDDTIDDNASITGRYDFGARVLFNIPEGVIDLASVDITGTFASDNNVSFVLNNEYLAGGGFGYPSSANTGDWFDGASASSRIFNLNETTAPSLQYGVNELIAWVDNKSSSRLGFFFDVEGCASPMAVDWTFDKSGPTSCTAGEQCEFTIDVTNNNAVGTPDYTGVLILDEATVPAGLEISVSSPTGANWTCNPAATDTSCVGTDIFPSGAPVPITAIVDIPVNFSGAELTNCVSLPDSPDAPPACYTVDVTQPVPPPDLRIEKTALLEKCEVGSDCPFEIEIVNSGGPYTGPLSFDDYLGGSMPPNMLLDPLVLPATSLPTSWYPSFVGCALSTGLMPAICSVLPAGGLGTMPANSSVTFTSNISIPSGFDGDTITNCVTLFADEGNGIGEDCTSVPVTPPSPSTEHFQCYNIKPFDASQPKFLQLEDQFGLTKNVAVEPVALCAPVDKNFEKGFEGVINETDHLVCYELQEKIPVNRLVEIKNQFGVQKMMVLDTQVLCVPSKKKLLDEPPIENPVLKIEKEAKTNSCVAGTSCEFDITVTNSGNGDFNGTLWLSDQANPTGLNINSISPPLSCSGNLLCETTNLSLLANGGSETFTFSVDIPPGFTGKSLENCVSLQDTAQGGQLDDDCDTVPIEPALPEIDFSVVKSELALVTGAGTINGYKIVVTNVGGAVNVPPGQIIVTDTVPAGLALEALPNSDWSCTPPALIGLGDITCEWVGTGTIVPNQQLSEIKFRAFSFATDLIENCARLSVDDGLGHSDVNMSNNGPSCVDIQSDLSVTKTLENGPLSVGDTAKFNIVGHYSATLPLLLQTSAPLTITDDLPVGFVFSGVSGSSSSDWSCSAFGLQVTCTYIGGGGVVMPGDLPELIIEATATTAGLFENCATIAITGSGPDANPLNDRSCPTFEVSKTEAKIDFSIEKSFEFKPGISSEFIIQVNNVGDSLFAPATILAEDTLPAGMMAQMSASTSSDWSCPTGLITGPANISCEWQGPFPVGPGPMPAIRFASILTSATPVRNCANVVISGGQSDVALGNNGPSCPVAYADIGIIKEPLFTGVLNIGDQANFALNINVSSDFQILNQPPNLLAIDDTLPAGLTFAGIVPNLQWTCTATGQQIHCELTGAGNAIGGNGIGSNGNFNNPLIIKTIVTGPVNGQNCAVISKPGSGADSIPGNNESCVDVNAKDKVVKVDLGVKKLLISKSPLFVGDIAVFELQATNFSNVLIGTSGSNQLLVTDTLPSGFEFVSATTSPPWDCTGGGRNVSCLWVGPPSTVIPGTLAPITVKAVVKDATGKQNCPRISISGQYVDVNSGNNGTCLDVDVRPKPKSKVDLGIRKEPLTKGPLAPGSTIKFKLYIDNHGSSVATPPAFQIKVRDTLPPGFIFLGASTNGQWACLNASAPGQIDCGWTGGQTIPSGPMGWIIISAKVPKGPAKLRQCAKVKITGQTDVHPKDNSVCIPVLIAKKTAGGNTGGSSGTFTPTFGQFACVSGLRNAASSLNMRTAPSGSARVIRKLPMGTALVVLNRKGKWSQVQVVKNGSGSAIGWVASQFTKEVKSAGQCKIPDTGVTTGGDTSTGTGSTGTGGSTGGDQSAAKGFLCVAGLPKGDNVLNLRAQPKASSKLISKLPSGSVLLLTAKRDGWNRVQIFDNGRKGAQGWVSGKYTKEVRNPATCRKFIVSPDKPREKAPVKPVKVPLVDPVKTPVIPLGNPTIPRVTKNPNILLTFRDG
jgi:uncharacterized repeat protein (TIGR01451 family)